MSTIVLVESGSTPVTPSTGKVRIFVGTDGILRSIDDAGVVTVYGITVTNEQIQDAVGAIFTDSSSIDFTYDDAGNSITAVVLPGGVNHNSLLNGGGNTHIDHSAVSITAGTGLSGGGDLTATRTLSLGTAGTAGTYGDSSHFPIVTTDVYGRVTSVSEQALPTSAWIDADGFLTWSDATGKDLVIRQANNGVGSAYIRQVQSRGTLASPTAVQNGDRLGGNGYYGWNNTGVDGLPSAAINGYATETHTSTGNGGQLAVEVIANGSTTPSTVATFTSTGMNSQGLLIQNVQDPVSDQDAATKIYVDSLINSGWTELFTTSNATSSSNVTLTNVAALSMPVVSGRTYYLEYTIKFESSAAATGFSITVGTSNIAAGSIAAQANLPISNDGTAALYTGSISSLGDVVTSTAVPASSTPYMCSVKGIFVCTTSGTILPQFRSEVNGSTVTFSTGSVALIREFV